MSTQVSRRGKMVNGFDPSTVEHLDARTRAFVERRARLLGPAYRLFYSDPVEFVRANDVLMYDADGNEYLDAYNNVVSVGHGHPRVVQAVHEQMQTLCTHTRYMHEGILDFAEKLLGTFEDEIGHMMLTCTGSEANDLALRMAKHHTGNKGIIVTSEAYHGNSDSSASFSPSLGDNAPLGTWVRRVSAPDTYRVATVNMGAWLAQEVSKQIHDLQRRGEGVAAFVVDSLFSSDGVFDHQQDILKPVIDVVRQAGGLFVADEVQCGFARSGSHMWGYQRHDVVPDIVTMGKPMGNGYPVAGVAMRPHVVKAFGNDMRYFNTFGGNTVAVAAANATFDVIQDQGLLDNSATVGAMLKSGVESLARSDDRIGDVRGAGLYLGVEMVRDRDSKTPDSMLALGLVNAMRKKRVLISATGFNANVLKIRPPLTFTPAHVDRFLSALESVLRESQ
ncbi:MAG: aminotransferase class III-fold pyridoxal phosphate-dependent enzyme [Pseudomonadota bacterium]